MIKLIFVLPERRSNRTFWVFLSRIPRPARIYPEQHNRNTWRIDYEKRNVNSRSRKQERTDFKYGRE